MWLIFESLTLLIKWDHTTTHPRFCWIIQDCWCISNQEVLIIVYVNINRPSHLLVQRYGTTFALGLLHDVMIWIQYHFVFLLFKFCVIFSTAVLLFEINTWNMLLWCLRVQIEHVAFLVKLIVEIFIVVLSSALHFGEVDICEMLLGQFHIILSSFWLFVISPV